jgi:hypothetical protein
MIQLHRSGYITRRICRRLYWFKYIAKLDPSSTTEVGGIQFNKSSPDLAIGSAVHAAMEYALSGKGTMEELTAAAFPILEDAARKGWSGCSPGYEQEALDHYKLVTQGMCWVIKTFVMRQISAQYMITAIEREAAPLTHPDFPGYYFVSRPDAEGEDNLGTPVVFSWKTCSSYTDNDKETAKYDEQGLTESYSYYLRTGKWPIVQMIYLVKGRRVKKDVPFVQYHGPLTQVYKKIYAKTGDTSYSPKYTSGWEKISTLDYPGGIERYYENCLMLAAATDVVLYAVPMAVQRRLDHAEELVGQIFKDLHESHSLPATDMSAHPADRSKNSCHAYQFECSFKKVCDGDLRLNDLINIEPRVPHHKGELVDDSD